MSMTRIIEPSDRSAGLRIREHAAIERVVDAIVERVGEVA